MRIHTNHLTTRDLVAASNMAGVDFHRLDRKGSRSRDHAFDVILEGTGRTGNRWGNSRERYRAATWDEWGVFLGELFRRDAGMTVPGVYDDHDHFRWATGRRYDDLRIEDQHINHKWEYAGSFVTGSHHVHECRCGAVRRYGVRTVSNVDVPTPRESTSKYESNGRYAREFVESTDILDRIDALIG